MVVERPGIGLSSFHAQRTLLDWPNDVQQLVDVLAIDRFAVVGASSAGPYAAVCAYILASRFTSVSVVSSPAPFNIPGMTQSMPLALRLAPLMAQRLPRLLAWSQILTAPLARRYPNWLVRQAFRNLPDVDQQVFHDQPDLEPMFGVNMLELY